METNSNNEVTTSTPTLPTRKKPSGNRKPANKSENNKNIEKHEDNHAAIGTAIRRLVNKTSRMPMKSEIARECGLSRNTVVKHMGECDSRAFFDAQLKHFNYMGGQVLAKILQAALTGDLRAAKLYFDILHKQAATGSQANTFISHRHNSFTVNDTVISQAALNDLPYEKLRQIEDIILEEKVRAEEQARIKKVEERYNFNRQPEIPEGIDEIQERIAEQQAMEDAEDAAKEAEQAKPENINNELLRAFDDRRIEKRLMPDGLEDEDDFYTRTRREILRRREEAQRKDELKE